MKKKSQPMRLCIGCGESKNKRDLLRIVMSPNGTVSIDRTGKAAGRGAYICPNSICFEAAYTGKRLEKSFKRAISKDVYDTLKDDLGYE
ncbi:hypothetical protein HMPREF0872_01270 [Veillonella montpellierensis DNF00314]|uniref:YlxR domain-containing protein n=1 Tax=Veillonella montpellierensis DNF00314 TaxID=1401067 RepID=A0A096ANI8_9FIRM|nr:YlxR family protein [Veillonella montpellierensis]KGF48251.1 hypothetical protein HMPREF0872_01270 [Veillonella montpellierensis DNF00314]